MADVVERAAAEVPLCAVLHTTMPPTGHSASSASSVRQEGTAQPAHEQRPQLAALQGLPPYIVLQQAVPHELLLPQVDFAVHHGGAGTTQALLLAGEGCVGVWCL